MRIQDDGVDPAIGEFVLDDSFQRRVAVQLRAMDPDAIRASLAEMVDQSLRARKDLGK